MIYDEIRNSGRYPQIPFLKEIQRFIASNDGAKAPEGEHEILGRDLFVRVAQYETGPASEKNFEAHRDHADFQWVVSGGEQMDYSSGPFPKAVTDYAQAADIQFFESPQTIITLKVLPGQFAFFFPGELHKPGCYLNQTQGVVKKLVFKIKMPDGPPNFF